MGRFLLVLALAATSFAIEARAQTKIIAGMVAHGPPQWPQYIATELGWLKQDNIEIDFVTVGASGAQQLAGGSIHVAHSGYPDFARAALAGAPVRIIINDITLIYLKPYLASAGLKTTDVDTVYAKAAGDRFAAHGMFAPQTVNGMSSAYGFMSPRFE